MHFVARTCVNASVGDNFMEAAYIQFKSPKGTTTTKTENSLMRSIKGIATSLLTKVFPVANPDFENKIDEVEYWLVECDKESGLPLREIGLDQQARVILKMPHNDNYGYWTDNNLLLADFKEHFEVSDISKEEFEKRWTLFDKTSDFQIKLDNFKVLSTGGNVGHKYLTAEIIYKGVERKLTIFFGDKEDEQRATSMQKINISGRLMDEGVQQSLVLLDAKIINE